MNATRQTGNCLVEINCTTVRQFDVFLFAPTGKWAQLPELKFLLHTFLLFLSFFFFFNEHDFHSQVIPMEGCSMSLWLRRLGCYKMLHNWYQPKNPTKPTGCLSRCTDKRCSMKVMFVCWRHFVSKGRWKMHDRCLMKWQRVKTNCWYAH